MNLLGIRQLILRISYHRHQGDRTEGCVFCVCVCVCAGIANTCHMDVRQVHAAQRKLYRTTVAHTASSPASNSWSKVHPSCSAAGFVPPVSLSLASSFSPTLVWSLREIELLSACALSDSYHSITTKTSSCAAGATSAPREVAPGARVVFTVRNQAPGAVAASRARICTNIRARIIHTYTASIAD